MMSGEALSDPRGSQTQRAAWARWLPAGLVVLLALLLASFAARNSDAWRHLATGRALLAGNYTFGTDPFAYTTEGATWVNHAWLYDLLLYLVHLLLGSYVAVAKAIVAGAIAVFMLSAAGVGQRSWVASFSVALALIALGPHLHLTPAVLSYFYFAALLWWLGRLRTLTASWRDAWPAIAIVMLWVNSDEWFLLGPLTVGMFGLFAAATSGGERSESRGFWLGLFALTIVACLLNPHHFRVFALPSPLADAADPASPFAALQSLSLSDIPRPLTAFVLLAVLCPLALLSTNRPRPVALALLGLVLLALSFYRGAAIPFFAIAAGPLLAQLWPAATVPRPRLVRYGPAFGTLALVALVVIACPGWLQGSFEPRAWHLHTDESLAQAARSQRGHAERSFHYSVDAAHYFEWFCEGDKVFVDGRRGLFSAEVLREFEAVRDLLVDKNKPGGERKILDHWQIQRLVIADPAEQRLAAVLHRLWATPMGWHWTGLHGRAVIFSAELGPRADLQVAMADRAFDPRLATTAPLHAPDSERSPRPRPLWDCVDWADSPAAIDRDEALIHLMYFEAMRPSYFARITRLWDFQMVGSVFAGITPAPDLGPAATGCFQGGLLAIMYQPIEAEASPAHLFAFRFFSESRPHFDDGPPGALLLAIRAARRAVHADPNDALAHFRLGDAYRRLAELTSERATYDGLPLLRDLRQVQAATALKNAVRLKPDLVIAHARLADLYRTINAFDLALPHLQAQLRLTRAAGPAPGEPADSFQARLERLTLIEQEAGKDVRQRLNLFETESFNLDAFAKAHLAATKHGLAERAFQILQASQYTDIGVQGATMEYRLMLLTGRTDEAVSWMSEDADKHEKHIGPFDYRTLRMTAAAALGDYQAADEGLAPLLTSTTALPDLNVKQVRFREAIGLLFGNRLLQGTGGNLWPPPSPDSELVARMGSLALTPRKQAELHTLRGMLALESGAIEHAEAAFRAALAEWNADDSTAFLPRHYLELMHRR